MPAAPAGQCWWVVGLALVVIVVCIGGVVLSLLMSCFALLVSWLFGSLKYSYYLCTKKEKFLKSVLLTVVEPERSIQILLLYFL